MGIRGIPANYGGFETFIEEMAPRLVRNGHKVTVFGRSNIIDYNEQTYISRVELFAPVQGEYIITTASYEVGVQGSYTLKIYSFGISGLLFPGTHQLALAGR